MLRILLPYLIFPSIIGSAINKQFLSTLACKKNPNLSFCPQRDSKQPEKRSEPELIIPPPMPKDAKIDRRKDAITDADRAYKQQVATKQQKVYFTREEVEALHAKCLKFSKIVYEKCQPKRTEKVHQARCAAYFRDCTQFIPRSDPLAAIGHAFSSNVGVTIAAVDVKGLPYYPINEEGAVGVDVGLNAPFGSWGGGYSDHVGVRDYWSQYQEVGANWVDGKYGYKNGWSVPLVQSLGVEGGQHNTVSVPLTGRDAGTVMVDNGYKVGGYYGQNDHVGVDWKRGNVQHNFGVGVPFVNTGVNIGQAVAWPGLDVWERALG